MKRKNNNSISTSKNITLKTETYPSTKPSQNLQNITNQDLAKTNQKTAFSAYKILYDKLKTSTTSRITTKSTNFNIKALFSDTNTFRNEIKPKTPNLINTNKNIKKINKTRNNSENKSSKSFLKLVKPKELSTPKTKNININYIDLAKRLRNNKNLNSSNNYLNTNGSNKAKERKNNHARSISTFCVKSTKDNSFKMMTSSFKARDIEGPEDLHFFYVNIHQQNKNLAYKFENEDLDSHSYL
jgi:hypothetical protein